MRRKRAGLRIAGVLGLALGLGLVGSELARGYLEGAATERFRDLHGYYTPPFRQGDVAPDFTLPDSSGKRRSLSSLVHQDTMLCFLCGCDRCRTMQMYLGEMLRSLGPRAPKVVSVSSAPPESEAAWRRDTKLDQIILYDSKESGKPVTELYRGHPCPRLFRLDADRRVTWIGPSPARLANLDLLGQAMARNLGYRIPPRRAGRGSQAPAQN
jgi:peroxiredoxin